MLTEAPSLESLFGARREHEVFVKVMYFEPWMRCQHGKQIVTVRAHWSDDAPFTTTTGYENHTQVFERTIHADGTPSPRGDSGYRETEFNQVSKCRSCGELNSIKLKQEAYGDRITCTACNHEEWYSIGD